MKIHVDSVRCEGHGLCEAAAPELFQIDDEGDLVVLFDGEVPREHQANAVQAIQVCPVAALEISEQNRTRP